MKNIDNLFSELAQYTRLQDETAAIIEGLKDEIKQYMTEHNTDILIGTEHKATYKSVTNNSIDTAALKQDLPDIAAQFTKKTETKRFLFQ